MNVEASSLQLRMLIKIDFIDKSMSYSHLRPIAVELENQSGIWQLYTFLT